MSLTAVYWHNSLSTYIWQVRYTVVAEDHDKLGGGWHTVSALYAIGGDITFKAGNSAAVPMSAYMRVSGSNASGNLFSGTSAIFAPEITPLNFKASRTGGSSGYRITWPAFSSSCQPD